MTKEQISIFKNIENNFFIILDPPFTLRFLFSMQCGHNQFFICENHYMKITGSQESIIQLDLDDEDEEILPDQRRRYSVSPMPQMQRSSESQVNMLTLLI